MSINKISIKTFLINFTFYLSNVLVLDLIIYHVLKYFNLSVELSLYFLFSIIIVLIHTMYLSIKLRYQNFSLSNRELINLDCIPTKLYEADDTTKKYILYVSPSLAPVYLTIEKVNDSTKIVCPECVYNKIVLK